jgi:hypothetical protein
MDIQEKIKNIVENIFQEEGFRSDFFENNEVKDLIEELYLTPEFREFDVFKKDEKGNELGGEGKPFRERDRRKLWTGKNFVEKLSTSIKEDVIAIQKVQTDRLLLKSEAVPELNGFFYKDGIKENVKDLMIRLFYNKIITSPISYQSLLFLDALFSKDATNLENYISKINLRDFFYPYFNNSLDAVGDFFKNIEVEKENKGMYNDIGFPFVATVKKSHISIVATKFSKDSELPEYIANGLRELVSELEFPYLERPEDQPNYYRKYFNNDFANNLASSLAKEFGDNQEVKDLFRSFLSSVGYEPVEIDRYLYLFVFPSLDFSECDPEPEILVETATGADCQEDFYDPVPADWTTMDTDKIFFDETDCSYVISFVTEYENIKNKNIKEIKSESKDEVSKKYLELFGKQITQELVEEISKNIVYKSHFINPRPLLKIRLLASLDKEKSKNILEESVDKQRQETEVISYNIKKFFENMESLSQIMQIYEQKMVVDALRGGSIYYNNLSFAQEGSMIEDFSNNIARLINPVDVHEFIDIAFEGNKIVGVELTRPGYKKRVISNGLESFAISSPQTRERTINFIKNLQDIVDFYIENRTGTYDVFVSTFFVPEPEKRETKSNITNYSNGSQQPINVAKIEDIAKRSLDFVASEVKRGYTSFSCLTEEQRDELIAKSEEAGELEQKNKFSQQLKNQIEDRFFSEVPDIFKKISEGEGKKALNELGKEFLNRLGVCGVGDIISLASSSIMAFMDPQEYMNELVKCAVSKMDPETARRFYNKINSSQILSNLNQGTNFLNTYRNFVGDALLPWDSVSLDTPSTVDALDENLLAYLNVEQLEDYNLRINAFADSLVISFDTEQLLDLLKNVPGGEWIRFFVELSNSIIRECKIVNDGDELITNVKLRKEFRNFCENKEDNSNKIPEVPKQKSKKKKNIAEEIAINAKEIVINLVVKLIVLSFRELMSQAAAALAFDVNYFKQGDVLPDFFQDREYFYDIIRETSNKVSISNREINELFLETLQDVQLIESLDLEEESIGNFLQNTSVVLDQKQKLDLLKGQPSQAAIKNILEASSTNGVSRILQNDPSKIGDVFQKFGTNVNIDSVEEKLAEQLEDSNVDSFFCANEKDNSYQDALITNKGLTEEEAEEQRNEQLEREKEKLCNLTNLVSNPISPIFGNALRNLFSKTGPIFGLLEEEKFKIFQEQIEKELSLLSIPFSSDLYDVRDGFLELMLHSVSGYTKTKSEFFGEEDSPGNAYSPFSSGLSVSTQFEYNPDISKDAYSFKIADKDRISLRENKEGENKVFMGRKNISEYTRTFSPEQLTEQVERTTASAYYVTGETFGEETILVDEVTATLNRTASNMFRTLGVAIDLKEENEIDKEEKISQIIEENMPLLIERYYGNIKREMLQSQSFSYEDWNRLYPFFTDFQIQKLLDIESVIEKNLLFYQTLEDDDRIGRRKKLIYESPFDMVLTKEDYIRISVLSDMLIRTYTLEYIFKSLFGFRTFSERFFDNLDMISNYIIRDMKSDLKDKDYKTFVNLTTQIYLTKISLGLQEVVNEDARQSLASLQANLADFRDAEREDIDNFLVTNNSLIEDVVADYSEQAIRDTIQSFRKTLSASNLYLDQFALGPIAQEGSVRDVVSNVQISEDFPEIQGDISISIGGTITRDEPSNYRQTRIIAERFIKIKEKENIPFSLKRDIEERMNNLFDIVNLDSWDNYLKAYDFSSYDIQDLWESWEFGLRISYVMPKMFEADELTIEERQNVKAYNVKYNDRETTLIPLAVVTKEIPNQQVPKKISDEYDLSCLIYDMSLNQDYKNLFTDIIDIETLISLLTIYSVENFAEFLVNSDAKGDLNRWLKNPKSFTDMKKSIVNILKDF